ncbi:MAG: hypothetical protein RBR32_03740 [Bacteroidales bacterium]|nr:hypothetical protein [Bacteroidales bacterium]
MKINTEKLKDVLTLIKNDETIDSVSTIENFIKEEINNNIDNENEVMREESGSIKSDDKLVLFFYLLMRDHLVSGTIENIMLQVAQCNEEVLFTNGWLASHAINIVNRLK